MKRILIPILTSLCAAGLVGCAAEKRTNGGAAGPAQREPGSSIAESDGDRAQAAIDRNAEENRKERHPFAPRPSPATDQPRPAGRP